MPPNRSPCPQTWLKTSENVLTCPAKPGRMEDGRARKAGGKPGARIENRPKKTGAKRNGGRCCHRPPLSRGRSAMPVRARPCFRWADRERSRLAAACAPSRVSRPTASLLRRVPSRFRPRPCGPGRFRRASTKVSPDFRPFPVAFRNIAVPVGSRGPVVLRSIAAARRSRSDRLSKHRCSDKVPVRGSFARRLRFRRTISGKWVRHWP